MLSIAAGPNTALVMVLVVLRGVHTGDCGLSTIPFAWISFSSSRIGGGVGDEHLLEGDAGEVATLLESSIGGTELGAGASTRERKGEQG